MNLSFYSGSKKQLSENADKYESIGVNWLQLYSWTKTKTLGYLTVLLTKKCKIFVFNFSIIDLIAAEGRYHASCCCSFESPIPKYASRLKPPSSDKLTAFNTMCDKLEDECELYTAKDFQKAMQKLGDDVYSVKMTKIKLEERYRDFNL